jgi:hypothetical protein
MSIKIFGRLLPTLVALLFFGSVGLSFYGNPHVSQSDWILLITFGIFVIEGTLQSFVEFYYGEQRREKNEEEYRRGLAEIRAQFDNIATFIRNLSDIEHVGLPSNAAEHIIDAMQRDATGICDIFFRIKGNTSFETPNYRARYLGAMQEMLKRGKGKYVCIGNRTGLDNSVHSSYQGTNMHGLIVKEADCDIPVTNFTIVMYEGKETEVYFGWDFSDTSLSDVFRSKDQKIVGFFKSVFDCLTERSKEYVCK